MSSKLRLMLFAIAMLTVVAACGESTPPESTPPPTANRSQGSPPRSSTGAAKVVETMDAANYTYVLVEEDGRRSWWAASQFAVAVGDQLELPNNPVAMKNFESQTLGRTFDTIYFVGSLKKVGTTAKGAAPSGGHQPVSNKPTPADIETAVKSMHAGEPRGTPAAVTQGDVAKAEGGLTVEEIFAKGKELAGKTVTLRARVVKWNPGIMGKNWLHVQDGTGKAGTNDLTVTTKGEAKVGETIVLEGKMVADTDLGYGYKFALLMEDAKITRAP